MDEAFHNELNSISDEVLQRISLSVPWGAKVLHGSSHDRESSPDPIFFDKETDPSIRQLLQRACWDKFQNNPQVNTAIRGMVGRLTGRGFSVSSSYQKINKVLKEETKDFRNRLLQNWPKYVGRSYIEGELHQLFTVHENGFVEVDFIDPDSIQGSGTEDGIIFHPMKTSMPLVYCIKGARENYQIPSVYVARDPSLIDVAKKENGFDAELLKFSRNTKKSFKELGGFFRFMVSWDRSFFMRRTTSYLRTVIKWLQYYEDLKKYEIDHKKASGAYAWAVTFDDMKAFRVFMSLTDEEKRETAIGAPITPGAKLILPPGAKLMAVNPNIPKISDSDTDILHMITSGLNEPEDVSTGQSKGTFASVKASRGPMSDRVSDEVEWFERFLREDFWGSIFFLKSKVSSFPSIIRVEEVVDFKDKEPKTGVVEYSPEDLIDITFPASEVTDSESRARAWLGVKHGSTYDTLGISNRTIAEKMGVQNYYLERLKSETEKKKFPDLVLTVDAESFQESTASEPARNDSSDSPPPEQQTDKKPPAKQGRRGPL